MLKTIWRWVKVHVLRQTPPKQVSKPIIKPKQLYVPKPGRQAIHQDIGKFMKHGRQAPWYKRSIKKKLKPEEEN